MQQRRAKASAAEARGAGDGASMMNLRVGVCASMIQPDRDPIGVESLETAAALGFDYIELSLAHLAALDDARFAMLEQRLGRSGLRCEACNNFFPPTMRLTGAAANEGAAVAYARHALRRAAALGVEVVVLGSSGAKNIPSGFPHAWARGQLVSLLHCLGEEAARRGVTIVLEPISRPEANFINRASEALEVVREVGHAHIQLLIDYFHLTGESEDAAVIGAAGSAVRHLHFAVPGTRVFPTTWDPAFGLFFNAVQGAGYGGRLSVEAFTADFAADGARALRVLRGVALEAVP